MGSLATESLTACLACGLVAEIIGIEGLEEYPEPCELDYDDNGRHTGIECGGRLWVQGGHGYYNGHYDCYTLYLICENCGPYEVECV